MKNWSTSGYQNIYTKTKSFFRFFCEDNIIFFVLIITIRCFPTLPKRNFRKKFENKILNWNRISSKTMIFSTAADDHHHDDDDDVDISTGDCGYRKHPIDSKIFRNNQKIVNFFQTQIQSATWSKYILKNAKIKKKTKILRNCIARNNCD